MITKKLIEDEDGKWVRFTCDDISIDMRFSEENQRQPGSLESTFNNWRVVLLRKV